MKWFVRDAGGAQVGWRADVTDGGLFYSQSATAGPISNPILESLLVQWSDAGHAIGQDGGWILPWRSVYELLSGLENRDQLESVGVPPGTPLAPQVISRGSLTDRDFTIAITGWVGDNGRSVSGVTVRGATATISGRTMLLSRATWELIGRVSSFAQRSDAERDERSQRIAWSEIRSLALAARARLDQFLFSTVVLSPERLKIGLRQSGEGKSRVIEVTPGFDGCPEEWLSSFDAHSSVRDRYDLPNASGIVQVIVRPEVRTVLEQIKRLPGRRVAGARAEAFVTNPFAALGEAASAVIDPTEFEAERERAGLSFDRFTSFVVRNESGAPTDMGLLIECGVGPTATSIREPMSAEQVPDFVQEVRRSLVAGRQLHAWKEFEFELLGNVEQELDQLERAAAEWKSSGERKSSITFDAIYDLSGYSDRIQGIGEEKPYVSPYIARKDEKAGWFPDNLVNIIELPPEKTGEGPRYIPLTPKEVEEVRRRIQEARSKGESEISVPGVAEPLPIDDIEDVVSAFEGAQSDAENGNLEKAIQDKSKPAPRRGLLIKPNVVSVDYIERRTEVLRPSAKASSLPLGLRDTVQLKQHQVEGVVWLQHLFSCSPDECRGALLADDMGLGKTLQLLTLIAWAHEHQASLPPALVVAPVALLENWREEARKFFKPGVLTILEVYGDTLADLRVSKHDVDEQLRREGLVKFLKPGWRGRANVVLTTYETLRDLEFSFAAEKWSIVVCDEAQKIKNPNALVTRAAKKQKARFRVACTGTPVENTLTDLWCLFDFIQPGLLGALNEFGQLYRRPIEAKTDEQKAKVDDLRKLTTPQTLRRLKSDVAKDLPEKVSVEDCRALSLSPFQRNLYAQAITQYSRRSEPGAVTPFKNALGLLQYLRLICTDPRPYGLSGFRPEPLSKYRAKAPKMDWLLQTLKTIRSKGEKALIFCEFRDMQILIRHYVQEELGYAADIINGDTSASSANDQSRQKRIRWFQERQGFGVIILSPLAVGFGVNIQAANHVIHYTRTWNPAKEDQATDRAYRIGQEKDVYVYCPVVSAEDFKTFDVRLDELLEYKRGLAEDMLNGSGDLGAGDFDIGQVAAPESPKPESRSLSFDDVLTMQPRYFEAYVAVLSGRKGYSSVSLTPAAGDDGIDVVAIRDGEGELIQCKTSQRSDRELSWEAIKDVVTGCASYSQRYPGVKFKKVCVATQMFNAGAHRHAQLNDVELIDRQRLAELHEAHDITLDDVERMLWHGS